jgi:hypothetical protein
MINFILPNSLTIIGKIKLFTDVTQRVQRTLIFVENQQVHLSRCGALKPYTNDISVLRTLQNIVWRFLQILGCAAPLRNICYLGINYSRFASEFSHLLVPNFLPFASEFSHLLVPNFLPFASEFSHL